MKLKNAVETFEAAPKGRYKMRVTATEAKLSAKGSPMIALTLEIREGEHAGKQAFDYLITDESFKGAGMAKIKLRGLGVDVDTEQTDEQVCGQLLGREVFADLDVEQGRNKDQSLKWQMNPTTGQQVPLNNNRIIAYHTAPVGAPVGAAAPSAPAGATATPAVPAIPAKKGGFPGFPGAVAKNADAAQPPFAGVAPPVASEAPKA